LSGLCARRRRENPSFECDNIAKRGMGVSWGSDGKSVEFRTKNDRKQREAQNPLFPPSRLIEATAAPFGGRDP
jgi:hypothetical protein